MIPNTAGLHPSVAVRAPVRVFSSVDKRHSHPRRQRPLPAASATDRRVRRPPAPVPLDSHICFSFLDPRHVKTVHGVALVDGPHRDRTTTRSGGALFTSRFLSAEFTGLFPEDARWNREKEAERLDSIRRTERSKRVNRKWGPSLLPAPQRRQGSPDFDDETTADRQSQGGGRVVVLTFECQEQATAQARWLQEEDFPSTEKEDLTTLEMPVEDAVYVSGLMRLPLMVVRSARCGLAPPYGKKRTEDNVIVEAAFLRYYSSAPLT